MAKNYQIMREKFMDEAEAKRLLKTCEDQATLDLHHGRKTWTVRYMLVSLAMRSGLRVAELSQLRIGDLHLTNGDSSYLCVRKGKGGRRRDCYFNGVLTKHLKSYIDFKKKTLRQPTDPDSYLFSRDGKTRYSTTGLHLSFKKALLKAGLPAGKKNRPGLSIHSARHTFATLTLKSTGNLRFTQKQLGHASISMTSLYADVIPEDCGRLAGQLTL